ncbi:aromatic ring-hydroxylating dioxygenase subunit alpha [Acinetobacter guerrae]|uniref:aromatic ring-hydroxylating dioxygenase subunit alpha n=1 Tax=Acinetobacter guerrae TaxID=1843371 RepID=UPI00128D0EE9|nr:aromatic ring-hydroxylating dioxygenase subunit alpha [Acinetobacter guerrae]MPW45688.1 phthalate 4,5-dioxygenase [Acinetobacter guerrae]
MLTQEKNDRLTKVGPDTEMGQYLRRYWHPIAGESEFDNQAIKPIRILGEDLVLYKDLSGNYGLVERHCPHRSADMSYGYVEQTGIRCSYHGWQFNLAGECIHQPYEQVCDPTARMCKMTKIIAYKVQAKAGLLWAYMGSDPVPELPDWDLFNYKNGFAQAIFAELPCNWFQCQENSIDPIHFEWTHNNWTIRQAETDEPYVATHIKTKFEEFEYGFTYKRLREGESEDNPMWTEGRVTLWPNGFYLGHHFEWRVPIDDYNTLSVLWVFSKVPKEQEPYVQEKIPSWYGPLYDENGKWITTHVANQDFAVWVGQGRITNREREFLGQSDRGIIMLRKRFFKELEELKNNPDFIPKALIFNPEKNKDIYLPSACSKELKEGLPRGQLAAHPLLGPYLNDFIGQAGQPKEVREAYEKAVGQKMSGAKFFSVHGGNKKSA